MKSFIQMGVPVIQRQLLQHRSSNPKGDDVIDYLLAVPDIELQQKTQKQDGQATDYYLDGTPDLESATSTYVTSHWGGKLAGELGLLGKPVNKEDMMALFDGFSPTGKELCQNAGARPTAEVKIDKRTGKPRLDKDGNVMMVDKGGRRAGYDLTHSPPKSVSLLHALGDDDTKLIVMEAQRVAVETSMSKMFEAFTQCRRSKGGKDVIDVDGLAYSMHMQFGSRELEPHLHTHVLVYNVCKGSDGTHSTFDASEIFRFRHAADMVYQNVLATELSKAGFKIVQSEEVDAHGQKTGARSWEVAGLHDRELINEFSSRHLEIMEERSKGTADAAAWLKTRKHKDEPSYPELMDHFSKLIENVSQKFKIPTIAELKEQQDVRCPARTREELLELLHENDAAFDYPTLLRQIGTENLGFVTASELFALADAAVSDTSDLMEINPVALHDDDKGMTLARRHTESRYAARWMVECELDLVTMSNARKGEEWWKVGKELSTPIIEALELKKGFKLSKEQRTAVDHIVSDTAGVCVASGFAGTGKTTVSDFYSEVYRAQGKRMLGCAVSNQAAKKLQEESRMECRSVTKILADLSRNRLVLTSNDVVVLDEAGMIDVPQIRALSAHCKNAGAKLILQGDEEQLKPVGAGQGMALMSDVLGESTITEIRRQKDQRMRDIVKMFYKYDENGLPVKARSPKSRNEVLEQSFAIWGALEAAGCIDEYNTHAEAVDSLVSDYFASHATTDERLVLAHSNADLKTLNQAIRKGYQERGEVAKEEVHIRAIGKKFFEDMSLSVGDRIRFTTADSVMNVVNGTEAKITSIVPNRKRGGFDVTVDIDEGLERRKLKFNTEEWNAIQHNYARTVHGAQGQGKTDVFLLGNAGMTDSSSLMVAISRVTKGKFTLYTTTHEAETLRQRAALDRNKENTLHAGVRGEEGAEIAKMFDKFKFQKSEVGAGVKKRGNETRQKQAKLNAESKQIEDWVGQHVSEIQKAMDRALTPNTQRDSFKRQTL
ncbi:MULTISPECIES: MobF family relaxase [Stenotrophomonas]|uniref:MobF family relaxase n=1 Tax=Stenotrophomonas TaxID=40323 RepID=UPI000872E8BB|nr:MULTISPECIES: MobF family relaxase [Stenotrophomonas]OEZ02040.1 hypothetical protein BIY45_03100 [Stenotrophomonas sp. BIIR7]